MTILGGPLASLFTPRRSFRARWRLGATLVVAATARCGSPSSADDGICDAITSRPDGIRIVDCPNATVSLDHIEYDRNGAKLSYGFIVTCQGRTARGTWSRTGGLTCLEGGADPCPPGGVCSPKSDADCRSIANCREWGHCGYQDGRCVPTDEGCARSDVPCGLFGQCHLGPDGACVVVSDADCQAPFGDCPDCAYKGACLTTGHCHAENGRCVALDSAECKKSTQCAFAGKCTADMAACTAASDADCTPSEVCRTARQCFAVNGVCTVKPPP
jgi:hypothetical protein